MIEQLQRAYPEMSETNRSLIALGVWENFGRVFGEFFHIEEICRNRVTFENAQTIEAIVRAGRGCVGCAAHLANWEIGAPALERLGLRPLGVYHPLSNPFVNAAVLRRRRPFYPHGLFVKNDPGTPRRLLKGIRSGDSACILADQYFRNGLSVSFFGRPALSTRFPAMAARATGAPLFVLSLVREPGVRFRARVELIDVSKTEDPNADQIKTTEAIQAAFERMIRLNPDQWMWTQNRWRM